jgi:hypothetical protein
MIILLNMIKIINILLNMTHNNNNTNVRKIVQMMCRKCCWCAQALKAYIVLLSWTPTPTEIALVWCWRAQATKAYMCAADLDGDANTDYLHRLSDAGSHLSNRQMASVLHEVHSKGGGGQRAAAVLGVTEELPVDKQASVWR